MTLHRHTLWVFAYESCQNLIFLFARPYPPFCKKDWSRPNVWLTARARAQIPYYVPLHCVSRSWMSTRFFDFQISGLIWSEHHLEDTQRGRFLIFTCACPENLIFQKFGIVVVNVFFVERRRCLSDWHVQIIRFCQCPPSAHHISPFWQDMDYNKRPNISNDNDDNNKNTNRSQSASTFWSAHIFFCLLELTHKHDLTVCSIPQWLP